MANDGVKTFMVSEEEMNKRGLKKED